jgi:HD superfamily phosphohydrolase
VFAKLSLTPSREVTGGLYLEWLRFAMMSAIYRFHMLQRESFCLSYDHERLTKDLIYSPEMQDIWGSVTPPIRADDIVKLAVGPKKAAPLELSTWETILAEIIIGDAFGADRIDYLLTIRFMLE